jgi:O-acetyl-ADP-ribose deacetylase (regulator of RNase III)
MAIEFVFTDENPAVVTALAEAFGARYRPEIRFVVGNAFCQGPGILISPANSRGDMGGGFDLQLRMTFGMEFEAELQGVIGKDYGRSADVRNAAAAAFLAVLGVISRNSNSDALQNRIIIPGFGTGMGGLDPVVASRAVFRGFSSVFPRKQS